MTLYLKYRPKTLNELDIAQVRDGLKEIVKSGKIPHAFLFVGDRGLGKTSAARILARIVNCTHPEKDGEPCNECDSCRAVLSGTHLDVLELDGASNRGIDDIRSLIEGAKLVPTQGKKKVYIIDEAHMLTLEASNALLKTLEEPPEHAMFILATTNPEKVLETISSRAHKVVFTSPKHDEVLRCLERVIKGESIKVSAKVMDVVYDMARGSFRDAVKILERFILEGKKLDSNEFYTEISQLGGGVEKFLKAVFSKDQKLALEQVLYIESSGESIEVFTEKIFIGLKNELLSSAGLDYKSLGASQSDVLDFLRVLSEVVEYMRYSPVESLPLVVAVVRWCSKKNKKIDTEQVNFEKIALHNSSTSIKPINSEKSSQNGHIKNLNHSDHIDPDNKNNDVLPNGANGDVVTNISTVDFDTDKEVWSKVLVAAGIKNKSVEALLKSSRPISYDGNILKLGVYYSFHKERLQSSPHRQILDEVIKNIFGNRVRIDCVIVDAPEASLSSTKRSQGVVLTETKNEKMPLTGEGNEDIIKLAEDIFGV